MDNTDEVVDQAVNVVALVAWSALGAAIGFVLAVVLLVTLKITTRKSKVMNRLLRRTRAPLLTLLATVGVWVSYGLHAPTEDSDWYAGVHHLILIGIIIFMGWYFYCLANVVQDIAYLRTEKDKRDAQRMKTQAQVLRRVLQITIVIATFLAVLLTFPATRAPLASLLASAGVLSVVVGLAAQSTIGNTFAGMQLAFTDAIRVGDTVTVMMSAKEQTGTIEEITLTYVVIRMWNNRRVLLPSSEFTTKPFENWTRASTDQLGAVEVSLDWPVPMAQVRQQVSKILLACTEWDHRVWNVQMTESIGTAVTVRVIVSAANPADRWDLECHVREELVEWISKEIPWALPHGRSIPEDIRVVNRDVSAQKVAALAEDLVRIAGPESKDTPVTQAPEPETTNDPVHAARLRASRKKAKRARRRSVLNRPAVEPSVEPVDADDRTMVMVDPTQVVQRMRGDEAEPGSRMFSGSPDAEELRHLYDGPGEEVLKQREETIQMQALDAQGKAPENLDESEESEKNSEKAAAQEGSSDTVLLPVTSQKKTSKTAKDES